MDYYTGRITYKVIHRKDIKDREIIPGRPVHGGQL
jgi:hypothetical protein